MKTMNENQNTKHQLNIADFLTLLRVVGTILLVAPQPLSTGFFLLYALTGLTDALDGWIARKMKTVSDFGARLDSIADLMFYAVMLFRIFPILWNTLPCNIWYAVAFTVMIHLSAYLTAAVKYHRFASLHTYLNKLTGMAVFLVPFLLVTEYGAAFCWAGCAVAACASLEELARHLKSHTYCPDVKSIFHKGG